jgi:hypothetical protein
LKALWGSNTVEQWDINCVQRFRKCGLPTIGCPWASFVQSYLSVRLFFVMYQRSSRCTDFREICCWGRLQKPVEKIQILLKSDKNISCFTWRPDYVYVVDSSMRYFVTWQQKKRSHFCIYVATVNDFILFKFACRSTVQSEHIFSFSWQQLSRERTTVLHYTMQPVLLFSSTHTTGIIFQGCCFFLYKLFVTLFKDEWQNDWAHDSKLVYERLDEWVRERGSEWDSASVRKWQWLDANQWFSEIVAVIRCEPVIQWDSGSD